MLSSPFGEKVIIFPVPNGILTQEEKKKYTPEGLEARSQYLKYQRMNKSISTNPPLIEEHLKNFARQRSSPEALLTLPSPHLCFTGI